MLRALNGSAPADEEQMSLMYQTILSESLRTPVQPLPVYLINIDRAADRLAEIQRQSDQFGIKVERVGGVDGALCRRSNGSTSITIVSNAGTAGSSCLANMAATAAT